MFAAIYLECRGSFIMEQKNSPLKLLAPTCRTRKHRDAEAPRSAKYDSHGLIQLSGEPVLADQRYRVREIEI